MATNNTYYVWRRNDGHVNASCNYSPSGFTGADGSVNTFEILLITPSWGDAYNAIVVARAEVR
jgi:hypothetical protein